MTAFGVFYVAVTVCTGSGPQLRVSLTPATLAWLAHLPVEGYRLIWHEEE